MTKPGRLGRSAGAVPARRWVASDSARFGQLWTLAARWDSAPYLRPTWATRPYLGCYASLNPPCVHLAATGASRQKDWSCQLRAIMVPGPTMKKLGTQQSARARVVMRDAAGGRWLRFARPRGLVTAWTLAEVAPGLRRVEEAVARERLYAAGFVSYEAAPAFDGSLVVKDDVAVRVVGQASRLSGGRLALGPGDAGETPRAAGGTPAPLDIHFPLLWFGLYEGVEEVRLPAGKRGAGVGELDWQASVGQTEFHQAMARIKALIRSGDTYQVNYTYRLRTQFAGERAHLAATATAAANSLYPQRRSGERARGITTAPYQSVQAPLPGPLPARPSRGEGDTWRAQVAPGDPWKIFLRLVAAQDPPYGAFLDTGEWVICSASPELFFRLDGARIQCRPMKGTAARGRTQAEDITQAQALQSSEKERAENVMVVDMVRHDLGRVAQPGSVKVARLFEVEKYPTLWQMTSTIEAQTEAGLGKIFQALFPAASVTGAPKVRTMQIIVDLESLPRRLYTGAIGFFAPGRHAQFNVAIRTLLVDRRTGCAEYGVGSGITWDSDTEAEWQECRTKARILAPPVPLFSLLETMRWTPDEGYYLLERHLERLQDSAFYFGFRLDLAALQLKLEQLAARLGPKPSRIRLLVSKQGRIGVEVKAFPRHLPAIKTAPSPCPSPSQRGRGCRRPEKGWFIAPMPGERPERLPTTTRKPQRVALARAPVDSSDPFLYHKTTNRKVYEAARAACPGYDDVLLFNEQGEVTESTIANVAVDIAGKLCTPPVSCGLLPGTMRAHLLQRGELVERRITVAELLQARRVLLLNSVRGLYPVEVVSRERG